MAGMRSIRPASDPAERPGSPSVMRWAMPWSPAAAAGRDPVQQYLDAPWHGVQDLARVRPAVAVAGRDDPEPLGGGPGPGVAPQRHPVPGEERQFQQRGAGARHVPVEDAGDVVALEAHVVGGDVVVPDQRRAGERAVPPRPGVGEAGHRIVERTGPPGHGGELTGAEHLAVLVDDLPGQVGQHLAALLVVPEDAGNVRDAVGQVAEQRVHGWGPRPGAAMYRVADTRRSPDVARQVHFIVVSHPDHLLPSVLRRRSCRGVGQLG